ncbi:MAG: hypothetical protein K6D91_05890 [Prevotella sp.]|nr:hypothetical protein [Prevotella sp.]
METNAPEKIYLHPDIGGREFIRPWLKRRASQESVEYARTDAFVKKAKEAFCKATCNGHPPRSTCTSLGTCREHDNFVKFLKGE